MENSGFSPIILLKLFLGTIQKSLDYALYLILCPKQQTLPSGALTIEEALNISQTESTNTFACGYGNMHYEVQTRHSTAL